LNDDITTTLPYTTIFRIFTRGMWGSPTWPQGEILTIYHLKFSAMKDKQQF
jgi:hypothetical protein